MKARLFSSVDLPGAAHDEIRGGAAWGQLERVSEVGIKGPITRGRIVIGSDVDPGIRGDLAVEHDHHGTVVSGDDVATPILQKARQVLHAAAVTISSAGLNNPRDKRGIDGGVGCAPGAEGTGGGGSGVVPVW